MLKLEPMKDIVDFIRQVLGQTAPVAVAPVKTRTSYRPRAAKEAVCGHCGASFQTSTRRSKYCSASCRTMAYAARKKNEG